MKKITTGSLIVLLLLAISIASAYAATAGSVTISLAPSASQVRLGNTVTVTGNVSASVVLATFDLNVTYDANQLQYVNAEGLSPVIGSSELDINPSSGKVQLLYLDNDGGGSGITSGKAFRITFKVIGGTIGDKIGVGIQVKTAGDANAVAMSATGTGTSMTLAAPLSTNANLSSLTVDHGTLSPVFAKSTTSYSLSVPFEVEKIKVSAKAEDANAKVAINSPVLAVGGTTSIKVTVTAPSGAKKTYTIEVSRAQDPNYVPSSNNDLTSLTVEGFLLSPIFDKTRLEYIIYLPFEIDQVTVNGTPEDSKASVTVEGNTGLQVDQANSIKVICVAEDKGIKTYTIVAMRALAFTGVTTAASPTPMPTPSSVPTQTAVSPTPQITQSETTAIHNPDPLTDKSEDAPLKTILLIVLGIATVVEGGVIVFLVRRRH